LLVACFAALALLPVANLAARAQEEETTRKIWNTAYIDKAKKPPASGRLTARRRYKVVTPNVTAEGVSADTVLGVTIWRLRPSRPTDTGERLIVHEGSSGAVEWIPERVSSATKFSEGDRVRLSFEAARAGFLYVIDREQYTDGTLGEPYLIFPTTRTRGGNNVVNIGQVVEIPSQDDQPPYFTLRRSRADQAGESLTVIVSPSPLSDVQINERAQKLTAEKVAAWEKRWGGPAGRMEMEDGEGQPWTNAEKAAGAGGTRALSKDEPAPQTLYYRPDAKSKDPVLVSVHLKYAGPRAKAGTRRR
jgi:hypothetical protein